MQLRYEILAARYLQARSGARFAAAYLLINGWSLETALRICRIV